MNIWGTILFSIKIIFPVCVVCVCVVQGQLYVCVCLCSPTEAREMPGVFSLHCSLPYFLPLARAFTEPEVWLCSLVCWQSTLGPCLPSSAGVTGMFSHTQLVTWALGFPLAFRVLFPHKAKSLTPRFLL